MLNFFKRNLNVGSFDCILIVSDYSIDPEVPRYLLSLAQETNSETICIRMISQPRGSEPPLKIARAMRKADIAILATSISYTHSEAAKAAARAGTKVVSMPGIRLENLKQGGINVEPKHLNGIADILEKFLKDAKTIRVTSSIGTNILLDVSSRKWYRDVGIFEKGKIGNLPAGEIFIAPKNSNGLIMIDGSLTSIGRLKEPIRVMVKNNRIIEAPDFLKEAEALGEFGIGLNPFAVLSGNLLEDEKVAGTVHFGFGNNTSFGGTNEVPLHLDGVITQPIVFKDNKRFQLP